jgi:putative ABC transport system permease protein
MSYRTKTLPPLAGWIISRLTFYNDEHALADAVEMDYADIRDKYGLFPSLVWCWFCTAGLLFHYTKLKLYWSAIMFKNYLKIAARHMRKYSGHSTINITGLAVSIACCLMIFMHVRFESSYDNYHKDADRIHRIGIDINTPSFKRTFAPISYFMAPYLKENFPQVEAVTRIRRSSGILVQKGEKTFYEDNLILADSDLFDVLTFPFIQGDPETALAQPRTLVITESMERKYFGDENSMGQIIRVSGRDILITGVVADPPENTHLKCGFIVSMTENEVPESQRKHWHTNIFYTYVKFRPGIDAQGLLPEIEEGANLHRDIKPGAKYTYFFQPLKDIHLYSNVSGEFEPPGNPTYLVIFCVIALLILIIASINFINLSTARAAVRSREVGMRKIVGAFRRQLIVQFLGESMLTTFLAVLLACLMVIALLPVYNSLTGIPYSVQDLMRFELLLALFTIILVSGVIAGSYPAFYLSSLRPVSILRGRESNRSGGKGLRRNMVVGQFIVSFILIAGTMAVTQQVRYMKNKSLGFEREKKIIIPVRQGASIRKNFESVKAEFLKYPGVTGGAVSSGVPGRLAAGANARLVGEGDDMSQWMYYLFVDTDFLREYGIDLVAGRAFHKEIGSDRDSSFIINETAVEKFGWSDPAEALDKILWTGYGGIQGEIVGVVKDFHYFGLQHEIGPLIIAVRHSYFRYITLTLTTEDIGQTLSSAKNIWGELFPGIPFDYFFLDTYFDRFYRQEEKVAALIRLFGILAISIACLGILGLTAHTTQRRTKEIGIRRVVGASVPRIMELLSKEFVKWIVVANLVAMPAAYFILNKWLSGFAYRTVFSIWFLLLPGAATLCLAALSVSYHTLKAAKANPVDCLKYE